MNVRYQAQARGSANAINVFVGTIQRAALIVSVGMCFAADADAQSVMIGTDFKEVARQQSNVPRLGQSIFGDQVSLYTGTTSFVITDVDIPGNNALPVSVGRSFDVSSRMYWLPQGAFGDWELEIPRMHGVFSSAGWQVSTTGLPNNRCSVDTANFIKATPPNVVGTDQGVFSSGDYWYGNNLYVPGVGDQTLVVMSPTNPDRPASGDFRWVTDKHWVVSCLPTTADGTPGEGFLVVSPDGVKYWFDRFVKKQIPQLRKQVRLVSEPGLDAYSDLARWETWILPSKIEDHLGNRVTYGYDPAVPGRLLSISGSDGRQLTLSYQANGRVSTVTNGARVWNYTYSPNIYSPAAYLSDVELPDHSHWQFNLANLSFGYPSYGLHASCADVPNYNGSTLSGSITHPSGAIGTFTFQALRHGRSYVPKQCGYTVGGGSYPWYPNVIDVYSITNKTITGPGLAATSWLYEYGPANASFDIECTSTPCPTTKMVKVTSPNGRWDEYTFSNKFDYLEGQILSITSGGINPSKVETLQYQTNAAGQPYPTSVGNNPCYRCDSRGELLVPLQSSSFVLDGTNYSRQINAFDTFARATDITRSSTSYSRRDITTYADNASNWVIGQIASSTNVNTGLVELRIDYWPETALKQRTWAFGKALQYFTYHVDGTLATVTDGNNRADSYTDWKRGIPQKITYADNTFKAASVNDYGWIEWVKDENGFQTTYGHDAMGRINLIHYPENDNVAWNDTAVSFAPAVTTAYGLPIGHWRRTESTGNARKVIFYDALWRPAVQEVYDIGNTANTLTQTVTRYDFEGRAVFNSYSLRNLNPAIYSTWADPSVAPSALGIHTSYDALGRPTQVQQDSEMGTLTTTTEYLAGPQTRVTNARGIQVTTSYMAYDQPTGSWPMAITYPEGAYTHFTRDVFGKPFNVSRHNFDNSQWAARHYAYDTYQRLCSQSEVESGTTAFGYDGASNLQWSASALPWAPSGPCYGMTDAVVLPRRIDRNYDARNRLADIGFPDSNGNQHWVYTLDGLPSQITTLNDNGTGAVTNTYTYNKRRLLTNESQSQVDMPTWGLGYRYNPNGAMDLITYPGGGTVDYAPNAIGQPTQAGSYATGVSYYPNGGMQQFTYGNGIVHTLIQNTRQLPDRSTDSDGVLDDSYDYDANGNVAAISDGLNGNRGNREMTYDDLDRLEATTSPMFGAGASYSYDTLDNLTRVQTGGTAARDHYYCYDIHQQLTNIKTDSCSGTSVIGLGYDAQGNLANKNGVAYHFDYGNRLREVIGKETYRYDAYGRRVLATHPTAGAISSVYGQDGVLRHQRNQREAKAYDYVSLNGSLVAKLGTIIAPAVPVITAPGYSTQGNYSVQWNAISGTSSYELQESVNGGTWQSIYTGVALSQAISGNTTGSYGYRVRACNSAGCGSWSAVSSVSVELAPAAPPALTVPATGPNGNYTISWGSAAGATSYTLEESINGGVWAIAYDGNAQNKSYTSRTAGSYAYRIKACNPAGCSGYSAAGSVQAIYPPALASVLTAPASNTTGSYSVSWTSVVGATSYKLEESTNGGAWGQIHNAAATSVSVTGKVTGLYTYRVAACNAAGCGPVSSVASTQVALQPTTAPGLTAPGTSNTGVYTVSWTSVANTTSYQLEESVNGGAWGGVYSGAGSSNSVSGKGNGSYSYRVRACNSFGCGPYSTTATTVVALPPPVPTLTASFLVTQFPPIKTTFRVSWTLVSGATSYEVQKITTVTTVVYTGTGTLYQYTKDGGALENGVIPKFSVRACNANGCSAWSAPITPTG